MTLFDLTSYRKKRRAAAFSRRRTEEAPRAVTIARTNAIAQDTLPIALGGFRDIRERIAFLDREAKGGPLSPNDLQNLSRFIVSLQKGGVSFYEDEEEIYPASLNERLRTPLLRAQFLDDLKAEEEAMADEFERAPLYTEEELEALELSLNALRPATAAEYVRYLAARLRKGGTLDAFPDIGFEELELLTAERSVCLPPSSGDGTLHVIVPAGLTARLLREADQTRLYQIDRPLQQAGRAVICEEILEPLRAAVGVFRPEHFGPDFGPYLAAYLVANPVPRRPLARIGSLRPKEQKSGRPTPRSTAPL